MTLNYNHFKFQKDLEKKKKVQGTRKAGDRKLEFLAASEAYKIYSDHLQSSNRNLGLI